MKILLLGEYSGVFTNLKMGFERMGHKVDFFHDGDGKKSIANENCTGQLNIKNCARVKRLRHSLNIAKQLRGYDMVIFINPIVVSPLIAKRFFEIIRKNNHFVYIVSCGDSYELYNYYKKGGFSYYAFDEDENYENAVRVLTDYDNFFLRVLYGINEKYIMKKCTRIIPAMYEYSVPYQDYKNVASGIPLPYDVRETPTIDIGEKIVIYFGKNKPFFKGANYIIPALESIQRDYPDEVEVIIRDVVPYDEYKEIINRTDILVDQCKAYAWGMNAIIAMSQGKIVLSGAEKESLDYFKLKDVPVINIVPDQNQIYETVQELILNRDKLKELKRKSFEFVKEFHSCNKVAKSYIDLYMQDKMNE